ncbi:MAG: hypothetical protein LBT38_02480 [Deltaproteobacteria bacterium]|jgi:chromosome segregation ATPase|nr:hypothetical protein [Deltaproteobacteria bacterium]
MFQKIINLVVKFLEKVIEAWIKAMETKINEIEAENKEKDAKIEKMEAELKEKEAELKEKEATKIALKEKIALREKIASLETYPSDDALNLEDDPLPIKIISQTGLSELDRLKKEYSECQRIFKTLSAQSFKNKELLTEQKTKIVCLEAELSIAKDKMKELEAKQATPKPNSQKSGLAPSNDVGKGKNRKIKKCGKKKGAQSGHKRNER